MSSQVNADFDPHTTTLQVARAALEQGGFLDELLEDGKKGGAKGGKGGNANKAKKR